MSEDQSQMNSVSKQKWPNMNSEQQSTHFTAYLDSPRRIPNKRQNECLLFGFCKRESQHNIPNPLMKLIISYYDGTFYWRIQRVCKIIDDLTFVDFTSDTFNINDIPFVCRLSMSDRGYIRFGIAPKIFPEKLRSITIHYKLCCEEKPTFYQNTKRLTRSMESEHERQCMWNPLLLHSEKCLTFDALTFSCSVDILRIQYNSGNQGMYCGLPVSMSSHSKFQWDAKPMLVRALNALFWLFQQHHHCGIGKDHVDFVGPYFDNKCFSLFCRATTDSSEGCVICLGLNLCQMPEQINSIKIGIKIWMSRTGKSKDMRLVIKKRGVLLSYIENSVTWPVEYPNVFKLEKYNKLSFKIAIDIVAIHELDDIEIPKEEWRKHGVILSDNVSNAWSRHFNI
eukprot:502141_1